MFHQFECFNCIVGLRAYGIAIEICPIKFTAYIYLAPYSQKWRAAANVLLWTGYGDNAFYDFWSGGPLFVD